MNESQMNDTWQTLMRERFVYERGQNEIESSCLFDELMACSDVAGRLRIIEDDGLHIVEGCSPNGKGGFKWTEQEEFKTHTEALIYICEEVTRHSIDWEHSERFIFDTLAEAQDYIKSEVI